MSPSSARLISLSCLLTAGLPTLVSAQTSIFINGPGASSEFGVTMVAGRLNRDLATDLAIGAPEANNGVGRVFLRIGTPTGPGHSVTLAPPADQLDVLRFGASIAIDDVDGDGIADIVVGAPETNGGAGRVFVFYGSPNPLTVLGTKLWAPGQVRWFDGSASLTTFDRLGTSVAITPDINQNGSKEVLCGASGDTNTPALQGIGGYVDIQDGARPPGGGLIGVLQTPTPIVSQQPGQPGYAMYGLGRHVRGGDFAPSAGTSDPARGDIAVLVRESYTLGNPTRVAIFRGDLWSSSTQPTNKVANTANQFGSFQITNDVIISSLPKPTHEVAGRLDATSFDRIIIGHPTYTDPSGQPNVGRVVEWTPGSVSPVQNFGGMPNQRFGRLVASLGDFNLDGVRDHLGASAPPSTTQQTMVWGLSGGQTGQVPSPVLFTDTPVGVGGAFGDSLVGLDFNGDGVRDYAIGSVANNVVILRIF